GVGASQRSKYLSSRAEHQVLSQRAALKPQQDGKQISLPCLEQTEPANRRQRSTPMKTLSAFSSLVSRRARGSPRRGRHCASRLRKGQAQLALLFVPGYR